MEKIHVSSALKRQQRTMPIGLGSHSSSEAFDTVSKLPLRCNGTKLGKQSLEFLERNNTMDEIFHEGQLAVQKITGEEEIAQRRIPMVRPTLHPRWIPFIEQQVLAFPGTEDSDGDIWLSLLVGEQGFISAPSPQEIRFDLGKITSTQEDIFFKNIATKPTVGLLFHEAIKRARYRAW